MACQVGIGFALDTSCRLAMEPTSSEKTRIVDVATLGAWAGVGEAVRDASLAVLGLPGPAHYRLLASIPPGDFDAALSSVRLTGDVVPTAGALSAVRLMHATARRLCLLDPWPTQAVAQPAALPPPATSISGLTHFKLNTVSDQGTDAEVRVMGDAAVTVCYDRYKAALGGMPPDEEDPTVYQLTAVGTLLGECRIPYVDFALFVPHALRHMKKIKLSGCVFTPDGTVQPVETFGPPSFDVWEQSYTILSTTLIMHDAVSITLLQKYARLVRKYATRYGHAVWHLVYQTDVRMRSKRMERIRIAALSERNQAVLEGKSHPFDPAKPCQYVWEKACADCAWWKEELEDHAMMILTGSTPLGSHVDGTAAIKAAKATAGSRGVSTLVQPRGSPHRRPCSKTLRRRLLRWSGRPSRRRRRRSSGCTTWELMGSTPPTAVMCRFVRHFRMANASSPRVVHAVPLMGASPTNAPSASMWGMGSTAPAPARHHSQRPRSRAREKVLAKAGARVPRADAHHIDMVGRRPRHLWSRGSRHPSR